MKVYQDHFTSGKVHEIEVKKGTSLFEALWSSGLFISKTSLRRLFKQGAIEIIDSHKYEMLQARLY